MDTFLQSKYEIDKDFFLLPDPSDSQHFSVAIAKGPFEGVAFRFNTIEIIEEGVRARFKVDYSVLVNEEIIKSRESFDRHVALILDSILNDLPEESIIIG